MIAAGVDDQLAVLNDKDKLVLFVDADAPPAGEIARKRLGLADGIIAVALNARDESVDAFQRSTVRSLPFEVLIPREVMPDEDGDRQHALPCRGKAAVHAASPVRPRGQRSSVLRSRDDRERACGEQPVQAHPAHEGLLLRPLLRDAEAAQALVVWLLKKAF